MTLNWSASHRAESSKPMRCPPSSIFRRSAPWSGCTRSTFPPDASAPWARGLYDNQNKDQPKKDVAADLPPKKDADDPRESAAEGKLRNARRAFKVKDYDLAENFLKQIISDYGETKTVVEAKSLLDEIKKTKK